MKNGRLKRMLSIVISSTMLSTMVPIAASATWIQDSRNNWNWIENGSKATGWKNIKNTWYHFDASGKMQTGWVKDSDSKWYYMNPDGSMKTGWLKTSDGKWYSLAPSGFMRTGWFLDKDGKWYFLSSSGAMQTGVIEVDGKIYALAPSGAMMTGNITINGVVYASDASGAIVGNKLPTAIKAFIKSGEEVELNNSKVEETKNNEEENTSTEEKKSSGSSSSSSSSSSNVTIDKDMSYDKPGTYGPTSGITTINNVSINSKGVTLRNVHIKGNLELGENIGDGDVSLENVTVDGTTIVRGGGANSIHFVDSVLATVIVNKNDGKIRIVTEGNSKVFEVQLESPAKLEESNLSNGATGFNNVTITEDVQTGNNLKVELAGTFETINSRATQVRVQLDEATNIRRLILNVAATVLGSGYINTAVINDNGSTISCRPENVVLNADSVSLRDENGNVESITESYSNSENTTIMGMNLTMNSIKVDMSNFLVGITENDFKVSAKLDGQDYQLENLRYNPNNQRLTFNPVSLDGNIGKQLKVTVEPNSAKLNGESQSDEITIKHGFTGKITDIHSVGIQGVTISFREGANSQEGDIAGTATTDEDGYYTVYLAPGQYTGEISGANVVKTYMYATSLSDVFNVEQNETAIRASGMDSLKIVLSWGERPYDEDSHLEGPTADGQGRFHTWYADKIYKDTDGIRYADLDWDDTDSYGPETTTIYNLVDGKYRFYVHNYSEDASLVGSNAKVEVYKGNNNSAPNNTFKIPNDENDKDSLYWVVFEMTVSNNGEDIDIKEINDFRAHSMIIKLADNAENSYIIHDNGGEYGEISGVPNGTVADLKSDLFIYDGGTFKVLSEDTYVENVSDFNNAVELSNETTLKTGQHVAVKTGDGVIVLYTLYIYGEQTDDGVYAELQYAMDKIPNSDTITTSDAVIVTTDAGVEIDKKESVKQYVEKEIDNPRISIDVSTGDEDDYYDIKLSIGDCLVTKSIKITFV